MAVPQIIDENNSIALYLNNDTEFQFSDNGLYPMAGPDTFENPNENERISPWTG